MFHLDQLCAMGCDVDPFGREILLPQLARTVPEKHN